MAQDVLGLGVKLYDIAIDRLLERVPDQCLVFVVLDAYSVRPLLAAIVRPGQKAGYLNLMTGKCWNVAKVPQRIRRRVSAAPSLPLASRETRVAAIPRRTPSRSRPVSA